MGSMRVLCLQGDAKVEWDAENEDEVGVARKAFREYAKKGFKAFRMTGRGTKGDPIEEFDPEAEEILFVPPVRGG